MSEQRQPITYRVLCIDGGGMRGIYSAAYFDALITAYVRSRNVTSIDLGKAFNLICGTSTGAILACALAWGIPLAKVIALYRGSGPAIFSAKVPSTFTRVVAQWRARHAINKSGATALEEALKGALGDTTIGELWRQRQIGLAIPAVEMSRHRSWVFKTPHLSNSRDRDGRYTLVQACMASTAAPIFRSMAWIPNPDTKGVHVFVDGGLWANNPVLVGLTDALGMTEAGDRIEIFCLGTCPPPSGDQFTAEEQTHRGYGEWKMGGEAASVSISAQQYAYDNMAVMLARHVQREVHLIRFPKGDVAANLLDHLDLDETRPASMDALVTQGQTDAYEALSISGRPEHEDGVAIDRLFKSAPESEVFADV